jgi:hypothetical protein
MASSINASTSGAGGVITTADNTGILNLQTAGTTAVTINSSQLVGVGTSSPTNSISISNPSVYAALSFDWTGDNAAKARIGANHTTGEVQYWATTNYFPTFYAGNSERMRIDSSGNLFLGKTADSSSVQGLSFFPSGSIQSANNGSGTVIHYEFYRSGTRVGRIETTTSATSYVTSSDYRLKEEIAPMTGALDKVAQLKPVTYKWKVDGADGQGFIAHELQEVIPDCVSGQKDAVNEDGSIDPQGIDTSFLVATLTAAIQEQQTIINDLKARITALEGVA